MVIRAILTRQLMITDEIQTGVLTALILASPPPQILEPLGDCEPGQGMRQSKM
jgi:hypothetical protein